MFVRPISTTHISKIPSALTPIPDRKAAINLLPTEIILALIVADINFGVIVVAVAFDIADAV